MTDKSNEIETAGPPGSRRCWIYRSTRRRDMYLYLAQEAGFDAAPKALIERMGTMELVIEIELYPGRKLARADADEVLKSLDRDGYYLQLPPADGPGRGRLQ